MFTGEYVQPKQVQEKCYQMYYCVMDGMSTIESDEREWYSRMAMTMAGVGWF